MDKQCNFVTPSHQNQYRNIATKERDTRKKKQLHQVNKIVTSKLSDFLDNKHQHQSECHSLRKDQ